MDEAQNGSELNSRNFEGEKNGTVSFHLHNSMCLRKQEKIPAMWVARSVHSDVKPAGWDNTRSLLTVQEQQQKKKNIEKKKKQFELQIDNNRRNVTAFKAAKTPGAWWDGEDTIGLSCSLALQWRKPEPHVGCKWRKMLPQGESPAVWGQQQQKIHSQLAGGRFTVAHDARKVKSWVWKVARRVWNYSRCVCSELQSVIAGGSIQQGPQTLHNYCSSARMWPLPSQHYATLWPGEKQRSNGTTSR